MRAAGEQRQARLEPAEQLHGSEGAHAARGQLDCERQPVQTLADPADRLLFRSVRSKTGLGFACPLEEERDRGLRCERLDRVNVLAGEVEDDPAGDEQRHAWRPGEQLDEARHGGAHMLGVVCEEQQIAPAKGGRERLQRVFAGDVRDSEGAGERPDHERRVA